MSDQESRYFRAPPTREKALEKIKHYCGYQERSHQEVKEKLYGFGLHKSLVEEIISELISENYLNEERFAVAYASGKFKMKGWGIQKISYELKQKRVSAYCIKKALAGIDPAEYQKTFERLAKKKWTSLKGEKNIFIKKAKWQNYLLAKGYEPALFRNFDFNP